MPRLICAGVGILQPVVLREIRLYARDEHVGREGLRYIVVRTHAEAAYFVYVLLPRRHHEYGYVQRLAELAADSEAVYTGQHEIQQYEVIFPGPAQRDTVVPGLCHVHLKARQRQIVALYGGDTLVILDNEYALHASSSFAKGNLSTILKPPPDRFSAYMSPPMRAAALAAMARPRPLP